MLDASDKKEVKSLIVDSLSEFFEKILAPYLDQEHEQNQKQHQETRELMAENMHGLAEYIKDHEKRITRLETAAQL